MKIVKIDQPPGPVRKVTFSDVLRAMAGTVDGLRHLEGLHYGILGLYWMPAWPETPQCDKFLAALGFDNIPAFEDAVNDRPQGVTMTWSRLSEFAALGEEVDVLDLLVVGCKDRNRIRRFDANPLFYEHKQCEMAHACDLAIELFDSTYWQVYAKNDKLIDTLAADFQAETFEVRNETRLRRLFFRRKHKEP